MMELIGIKRFEKWYPKYAPHIILGTNKSILDYNPYPSLCMGCGEHIYYCTCKKDKK